MFKPMDQELARSLLEGQPDLLSEEAKEEEELYRNLRCPICYEGGCEKLMVAPRIVAGPNGEPVVAVSPFVDGKNLPQGYAHCIHCGTDFDPRSGVIRKTEASQILPVDLDPATTIVSPPSDPRLK
jgi:hypothetical protein